MKKLRILLVEDDPRDYKPMYYILRQNGFDVVGVNNADDGIKAMDETIDLAVVDILIPGTATFGEYGIEVCQKIKQKHPNTPVIIFSNWANIPEFVEGCKDAGADEIISKRQSTYYLIERINEHLKGLGKVKSIAAKWKEL